jgi:arylsulfatase A-like enzyme
VDPELRLYRDETRFCLRELAAIFTLLQAQGLWDSTVLVVVGDHGEMFESDGHDDRVPVPGSRFGAKRFRHGHALYDELVRVPLVIRPAGGLRASRWADSLVSHVDLHDTIADLTGIGIPKVGRDRVSVASAVVVDPAEDGDPPEREHALACGVQYGPRQRVLLDRDFKLIDRDGQPPSELYDLRVDPGELHGVEDEERMRGMRQLLDEMWQGLAPPPETDSLEVDAETREQLKALGYGQ